MKPDQEQAIVAAGLNPEKVEQLLVRAGKEVQEGLLPAAQMTLARHGKVIVNEHYGAASADSLFCVFSATKAITVTAAWLLIEEGKLDISQPVVEWIPEFAENGKEQVIIEQLFTHTAGFPTAPFPPWQWQDKAERHKRFGRWRMNWPAGSQFEYHASSSMYVIADLIERITRQDWRAFAQQRIIEPLGLNLHLGSMPEIAPKVLPCEFAGQALTKDDYRRLGLPEPLLTEVTEEAILAFNQPEIQSVGIPGGGAIATSEALALFYQALLRDGKMAAHDTRLPRIWQQETIQQGLQVRTSDLTDPGYQKLANYALGLVVAGDETRGYRGFGQQNSATAFGHNGAGGQISWADPATGLSFAYCTNGHDRNRVRQGRRVVSMSNKAAVCCNMQ